MLFVEFRFFWFFLAVFCVYWSLRENRSRKIWLLLCSYFFYAAWNWKFLFLLMASSGLDYVVGMMLARTENPRARRSWLIVSLCVNLGTIAIFKYCNFFISSAATLLAWLGLPASIHTLDIIIPVGVSFYTFHSMSYTIDVYRGKMRAVLSILDVACFIGFFPQMVAGPIVRAAQFLPQLQSLRIFSNVDVRGALVLFLVGFVKKACIADGVAPTVDKYFDSPANYSAASAWLAVLFYGIQIYCDFSGYSDMALGLALVVHRAWQQLVEGRAPSRPLPGIYATADATEGVPPRRGRFGWLAWSLTFYWICFTWIFFRAADLERACVIAKSFVFWQSPGTHDLGFRMIWIVVLLGVIHRFNGRRVFSSWWRQGPPEVFAAGYGCAFAIVLLFIPPHYAPFIYFQF